MPTQTQHVATAVRHRTRRFPPTSPRSSLLHAVHRPLPHPGARLQPAFAAFNTLTIKVPNRRSAPVDHSAPSLERGDTTPDLWCSAAPFQPTGSASVPSSGENTNCRAPRPRPRHPTTPGVMRLSTQPSALTPQSGGHPPSPNTPFLSIEFTRTRCHGAPIILGAFDKNQCCGIRLFTTAFAGTVSSPDEFAKAVSQSPAPVI